MCKPLPQLFSQCRTASLKAIFNWELITADSDITYNSTVDLSKLPKALCEELDLSDEAKERLNDYMEKAINEVNSDSNSKSGSEFGGGIIRRGVK